MKYDDIIDLPHHRSTKHAHLSKAQRSAQFASFAALKGFEDEIAETARTTDEKRSLDENEVELLNESLQYIQYNIDEKMQVRITYFLPDKYKSGGEYDVKDGIVKRIDTFNQIVVLEPNVAIPIYDIIKIEL